MAVWTCGKCGTINSSKTGQDSSAICRSCGERMFVPKAEQTVSS